MNFQKVVFYLFAFVATFGLSSCGYNSMVDKEETVSEAWAQVQNVYQRRADLIPNLVETVKASANFEQKTLQGVIEARAKATSITLSADQLTPENISKFQAAQSQLSGALSRLMAVAESYPQLQTTVAFRDLMTQLEGTENRITVERMKFNSVVKDYNATIRKFPNNFVAGWFGFEKKGYFEADAGAEKAPKVNFE